MAYRHDQNLNKLHVVNFSASTITSGTTDLYNIFATSASIQNTYVQSGINTFTGGTALNPTVNITSATLNNLSTSGTNVANSFSATTLSGGTIFSGSTNLQTTFNSLGSQIATKANLSGATFTGGISAPSISGGTFTSGGTDLYNIFLTANDGNDITRVQSGINTTTGGTANNPTINITSAVLNNLSTSGTNTAFQLSATTISGGTFISGGTDLYNIFLTSNDGNDITRVQPGTNTTTGGTANNPTVNITSATLNNLSTSGTNVANSFSATSLSGGTIYSGSTDLQTTFNSIGSQIATKANLSGATFTGGIIAPSLSATTLSGGTIYSGNTDLYNIFLTSSQVLNGSGIANYLTMWTGSTALATSIMSQSNSGITIHGNLTVEGTATTINSVDTYVVDNLILINSGETGGGVTKGEAGIEVDRGTQPNVKFIWIESGQTWSISNPEGTGTTYSPILTTQSIAHGPVASPNNSINYEIGTGMNQDIVYLSVNYDNSTIGINGSGQIKVNGITGLTNGTNTTANSLGNGNYSVSLNASPSINNLTFSGTATGGNINASNITGATFYSGGTELSTLFAPKSLGVIRTTATTYTVLAGVDVVSVNQTAAVTINLQASPVSGRQIIIKDATVGANRLTNPITVNGNGSNIDGGTNTLFENNFESATFIYDGTIYITV